MSIATAIQNAQTKVANAYTAISNKGGTLPATQDLANMPTAIDSIPSGGGSKYGCTIDNLLGDVDANGVLQLPVNTSGDIVFSGVKDVASYGLYYKYFFNTNLTHGVSFLDLEEVSTNYALYYAFGSAGITSVSLLKLKTVSGKNAMQGAFSNTRITSANLSELETVSGNNGIRQLFQSCAYMTSISAPKLKTATGTFALAYLVSATAITIFNLPELTTVNNSSCCYYLCSGCNQLETVNLTKLSDISGASAFNGAFTSCPKLQHIYLNGLTTSSFGSYVNQFNNMFNTTSMSTSGNVNIHFPSNLSSTISGLQGYPNFGATAGRVTLLFDLPATS